MAPRWIRKAARCMKVGQSRAKESPTNVRMERRFGSYVLFCAPAAPTIMVLVGNTLVYTLSGVQVYEIGRGGFFEGAQVLTYPKKSAESSSDTDD